MKTLIAMGCVLFLAGCASPAQKDSAETRKTETAQAQTEPPRCLQAALVVQLVENAMARSQDAAPCCRQGTGQHAVQYPPAPQRLVGIENELVALLLAYRTCHGRMVARAPQPWH